MQKDKVRVYELARKLNVETKDLLDMCKQAGLDVKNQLSSLDPEQRDAIEELVKRGGQVAVQAAPSATATLPEVSSRVRNLNARPRPAPRSTPTTVKPAPPTPVVESPVTKVEPSAKPVASPVSKPAVESKPPVESKPIVESKPPVESKPAAVVTPAASPAAKHPTPAASLPEPSIAEPGPSAADAPPAVAARTSEPVDHRTPEIVTTRTQEETPARETEIPLHPQTPVTAPPPLDTGKVRNLKPGRGEGGGAKPTPRHRPPLRPVMRNIATPPPLKPSLARPEKDKSKEPTQKPIARPVEAIKGGQVSVKEIINKLAVAPGKAVPPPDADEDELDAKGKKKRPGQVVGRDTRHKLRNERAEKRKQETDAKVRGGQVIIEEEEARPRLKQRARAPKPVKQPITLPRKGKVPIELPITVRSLSAAIGVPAGALLFKLRDHGALPTVNINSTLEPELAEVIALDVGIELDIKRPVDSEEQLLAELAQPTNPEDLRPRAPVVTIMGHVDHGKTSLLDKIRQSNVVATEAGGITQVIRAWRVEHGGRPVTFLDTPGHEAFTKMRARGAQVTDVAVIVVAADDGVMPQTEEAINHAKAAGVPIVVAINKVDLPNANLNRTRQQLYGMELIPDNMGGDVPFVETSAATGKGIDELLDVLSLVAEMRELKANPTGPGRGTCLEAMLSEDEGVRATLLVQSGTLHRGDVILCGATYGRVRAMYDDLGRPIQEAGPSVPVRITGLDEVPNADDPFQVVPDLALARSIAERRKSRQQEAALVKPRVFSLETLAEIKIAELKVILKADFRGSIEAIRKELDKLHHEEVRVRILHTGIGAITESDVQLALASPSDTVIIGFNVVPDDRAQALAEEKGISLRLYNVIYQLTDDIKAALEGKLKPREEIVHLGRAVVREIFKISRIGTIAGCYVTQGTIERSAKVRLIRQGVVIYPPPDRTASLDSLKRFKDDVREVREGFECGLKIAGYDDLKVDDVIEAYKIEQVQRTL